MTKFIAKTGLLAGQFAVALGNYWFTFGLWPKSWVSYVLFFVLSMILLGTSLAIDAEKS